MRARGRSVAAGLVCAAIAAAQLVSLRSAPAEGEWRAWAADRASTRYAPLDQINRDTVPRLKIAWRQSGTPDALNEGRVNSFPPPANYQHTPLMVDGLLYMSTGLGTVAALDPTTGEVVWFDRAPAGTACAAARWRTAASPTGATATTDASSRSPVNTWWP